MAFLNLMVGPLLIFVWVSRNERKERMRVGHLQQNCFYFIVFSSSTGAVVSMIFVALQLLPRHLDSVKQFQLMHQNVKIEYRIITLVWPYHAS